MRAAHSKRTVNAGGATDHAGARALGHGAAVALVARIADVADAAQRTGGEGGGARRACCPGTTCRTRRASDTGCASVATRPSDTGCASVATRPSDTGCASVPARPSDTGFACVSASDTSCASASPRTGCSRGSTVCARSAHAPGCSSVSAVHSPCGPRSSRCPRTASVCCCSSGAARPGAVQPTAGTPANCHEHCSDPCNSTGRITNHGQHHRLTSGSLHLDGIHVTLLNARSDSTTII